MVQSSSFKTQVVLTDYFYQRDIEYRILISELGNFEIDVLREILHDSLHISVKHLAESLEADIEDLIPVLDSLSRTKLFKREGLTILVDKETRKYYEIQMEKFNPRFEPNLGFIQNMLNNVPLNVLLLWYTIPRTSNNIFSSIVNECLLTPKIYRQYMNELQFKEPILKDLIKDLYNAQDFKLFSKEIIAKYQLTREEFEKHILFLEYHFICCLTYQFIDGAWQEVVTPFAEWLEYLQTEIKLKPHPIQIVEEVIPACKNEFGFIEDLATIISTSHKSKIAINEIRDLNSTNPECVKSLENKILQLEFARKSDRLLTPTDKGLIWARKSLHERVTSLAVDPLNFVEGFENSNLWNLRTIHAIEKSLRHLKLFSWVDLEDFLKSLLINIGDTKPTMLQKKGKKWKYVLPEYTSIEIDFVSKVIMERCYELGIVMIGNHQGRPCFYLARFGKEFIY